MPLDPRPARTAKLVASLNKNFGEAFDIFAMVGTVDVDARSIPDVTRSAMLNLTGLWDGPADSTTPFARGASTDDVVHNWTASHPAVTLSDVDLIWTPRRGDKVVRRLDGAAYVIIKPYPNGLGRTLLQLSSKAR